MHTLIRDAQTTKHDFVFYADRLIRLVGIVFLIVIRRNVCILICTFIVKRKFFLYLYKVVLHMCLHQVVEHGLGHLPFTEKQVITPTGESL